MYSTAHRMLLRTVLAHCCMLGHMYSTCLTVPCTAVCCHSGISSYTMLCFGNRHSVCVHVVPVPRDWNHMYLPHQLALPHTDHSANHCAKLVFMYLILRWFACTCAPNSYIHVHAVYCGWCMLSHSPVVGAVEGLKWEGQPLPLLGRHWMYSCTCT